MFISVSALTQEVLTSEEAFSGRLLLQILLRHCFYAFLSAPELLTEGKYDAWCILPGRRIIWAQSYDEYDTIKLEECLP